ncbi:MAG: YbgC/FadM family acyl-CoA thioesterase [Burkholderiales bacterium]|nr:YbgC/FadM family acyl-CoA thioesterase [Burkholderiales bacterium]
MKRSEFRFHERLRVRWVEVDLQKIVFNGHYLTYFDTAVAGYWRALALPYQEAMARLDGDLYVRKATLEYLGSARYDERIDVGIRCDRIGQSSIRLGAAVFRGETCLVHGELVYVFADPATQKSRPVPAPLREAFEAFEAGLPMVQARVGSWAEQGDAAREIRQQVFADEQRIPAEILVDEADASAVHALLINRLGMAVASGRLLASAPGVGQIGRMATLATVRGAGIGRVLLDALVDHARARGDQELRLHAQSTAVSFYERAGFERSGPDFVEAGIGHVPMRQLLRPA